MHPAQSQPMYFSDLFAEIQTNVVNEPQINAAPSAAAFAATLPSQNQSGAHLLAQNPSSHPPSRPAGIREPEEFSFVQGEEEEEEVDDEQSESARARVSQPAPIPAATQTQSQSPSAQPSSQSPADRPAGKRRKQELHRRHSKRYRDNLGELFHELEQILPQVVPDCKLKTKSQIIATSVSAVKQLKLEVSTLEMRYVMSSPANRAKWVEDTVSNATVIQDAIEPFMRLLLGLQSWKHSELWMRMDGRQGRTGAPESAPDTAFVFQLERVTSATSPPHLPGFQDFVAVSQIMTFEAGDDSMVGRIATSLSPEWIDLKNDASLNSFKRGEMALRCGLVVCFAVPFLIRGHVTAVVLFYDSEPRGDVQQRVSVAQDLASAIGNCYGALAARNEQTGR